MGINNKYISKFEEAYKDLQETVIPFEFIPSSPYYHQESWREVLPMFVPGVVPHTYWISNLGRVYTNLKSPNYPNGGIMVHSINQRGYHQINLKSVDGKKIGIKISRLVMLHFKFIPGCHKMEVDHLDGDKDNNVLWNFEWVNGQENIHRAIKNGLRPISCTVGYYGENHNYILLTDQEARNLFREHVQFGISKEELSAKYNVSYQYIEYLSKGVIRPYIYKEYIMNKIKSNLK